MKGVKENHVFIIWKRRARKWGKNVLLIEKVLSNLTVEFWNTLPRDSCVRRPKSLDNTTRHLLFVVHTQHDTPHYYGLHVTNFEATCLNPERLHYFATVTRPNCYVSEKFKIVCIPIYFERHDIWITIHPQVEQLFRYIVSGNYETMIF